MSVDKVVFFGIGCCKIFIVCICIVEGLGKFLVNDCEFEKYFFYENFVKQVYVLLFMVEFCDKIDVIVNVVGGGVFGQVGVVVYGIVCVFQKFNFEFCVVFKKVGYFKCDLCVKECKKFG